MLMKPGYLLFTVSFSYSLKVALDMVSAYTEPLHVLHYIVVKGLDACV